jgi:phosphoserine phosphatase
MRYCFDLDGTLVTDEGGKYENCKPLENVIARVRKLYAEGHVIIIITARGVVSKTDRRELTAKQLKEFDIPYHELIVGLKPSADYFVDDKAINVHEWMEDEEKALARVKTVDHVTEHVLLDPFFPYAQRVIDDFEARGVQVPGSAAE